MALSPNLAWEVRGPILNGSPGPGSDNNGGGFRAGAAGTDRSQQNAAQVAIDNSTITTSITANVITFTGYVPTSADVGNVVQMLTGTNVTAGFYEITAQTATTWTVTGTANLPTSGTTTNATGNMGGALATLGKLSGAMVANNAAWATGAFTATATATFAQAVALPSGGSSLNRLAGYGSVRGDGTHATLALSTNTGLTGIALTGGGWLLQQVDVDCGSLGTSTGISIGASAANVTVLDCKVSNFTLRGISNAQVSVIEHCELTGGTAAATAAIDNQVSNSWVRRCNVHDNACPGIKAITNIVIAANQIVNNSGASSDGIQCQSLSQLYNNTIHNNGRHGINNSGGYAGLTWLGNILTSNGGFGSVGGTTAIPALPEYDGNAYFNNTSGARSNMDSVTGIFGANPYTNVRDVTLTGSPYVGPTTGTTANFGLNNTAGAGAACRAKGLPGTWPGNSGTTGFLDMGAVQHQDSGSGGLIGGGELAGGLQ